MSTPDPTPTPLPAAPDWRALCADLLAQCDAGEMAPVEALEDIRAALATQPAATREVGPLPQAPTDEDLDDLCAEFSFLTDDDESHDLLIEMFRAVLARWGCAAVPVPVSERPWERPGWCDADGYCWAGYPSETENLCTSHPQWLLTNPTYIDSRKDSSADSVVLLPHWALPVPAAAAGEVQP